MALSGKQKLHKVMAKAHKWIGLFVGIQVVLWTMGGVIMSWIPIEEVRGEHKIARSEPVPIQSMDHILGVAALQNMAGKPIVKLVYESLLGQPVAKIQFHDGSQEIRNALTGQLLTPISPATAQKIAEADYSPEFPVASVDQLKENNVDYRGPLPVWRVRFGDSEETAIYVSPTEASVVGRRSSTWRLYDFFWMLHIMDYDERHDFNNPLLIVFSASALMFALSGIFLLFFRFYRRDFNFLLGKRKHATGKS